VVSPQFDAAGFPLVAREAETLGLGVIPWTLNDPASVAVAAANGAEAVITDDPPMAEQALP
jgi:glycerophosphoryl diester phosphodiesterase